MKRFINLSLPAHSCPEGTLVGGANPIWGGYTPDYDAFVEYTCKTRPASEILGYYDMQCHLLGPFPGELFNIEILTSKPHCTFATYHKMQRRSQHDAIDLSTILPEQCIGNINVINVLDPAEDISAGTLKKAGINTGEIVFIRTDISKKHREAYPTESYFNDFPGISFEAAEYLASKGIKAVGIDARDIEPKDPAKRGKISVTQLLNDAGVIVVQDMANIDKIRASQKSAIIGIPIKMRGMIGGPARIVALDLNNPEDYTDLTNKLKTYPSGRYDRKHGWMEPLPERIDPRDLQGKMMFTQRLLPFKIVGKEIRTPDNTSQEQIIYAAHATNTHVECAYFDPLHVHNTPEEILCRYKEIPLDRMLAPASLLDLDELVGPRQQIDAPLLEKHGQHIRKGDILLCRTSINDWFFFGEGFMDITAGFTVSAANWLVGRGIRALAIDWPSVERSNPASGTKTIHYTANDVHYTLHNNDIPVVENVWRMGQIRKEHFNCAILPLQAHNLGGFQADMFIWEDWE